MVIFPGKNRNAPHKNLWNHFGPYKILEINESSATLVPVDKNAEKIKLPLERLIHLPPGVPDVATLPRGKNPFKNILMSLILENVEKINGQENFKNLFLLKLLSTDENMEFDVNELSWTKHCLDENEELKIADLDPVLDKKYRHWFPPCQYTIKSSSGKLSQIE